MLGLATGRASGHRKLPQQILSDSCNHGKVDNKMMNLLTPVNMAREVKFSRSRIGKSVEHGVSGIRYNKGDVLVSEKVICCWLGSILTTASCNHTHHLASNFSCLHGSGGIC